MSIKITFDTTTKPDSKVVKLALKKGFDIAYASVSITEAYNTDFEDDLRKHNFAPEVATWDQSSWDEARWAKEQDEIRLREILKIISNNSFPKNNSNLTEGQKHQLRDAMILEAHSAASRNIFVTKDKKAFISENRREKLENLLDTRILNEDEFFNELKKLL